MAEGFGTDIWCANGLQTGRYARGWQVVAQALYRRLITPRGTLQGGPEEENYGIDLAAYCGEIGYPPVVNAIPGVIRAELLKDDRVEDIEVRVMSAANDNDGTLRLTIEISAVLVSEEGAFTMTVGVDGVTTTLLGLAA